jgi:hypothetical protein
MLSERFEEKGEKIKIAGLRKAAEQGTIVQGSCVQ